MYLFVLYLYRLVNSCFYNSLLFLTVVSWCFSCPSSDLWEPLQADSHDILIGSIPVLDDFLNFWLTRRFQASPVPALH